MSAERYDVAVVGASVAGCTAARLFAQRGARVALIERRPDIDAHKTVCTHYIQPSATPTIERLGLAPLLDRRGAVHNSVDIWTRHGGWMVSAGDGPYGYSLTRRSLDPILRRLAADTDGVDLLNGWTAAGLRGEDRPAGVSIADTDGGRREIDAPLVVAADGHDSDLARLARVPARKRPNSRFFHWAYWSGLEPSGSRSRTWILEPDCAYTFPNEDGLTVLLVGPHRDRAAEFRADREGAYMRMARSLPDAPGFAGARRESKLLGKLDLDQLDPARALAPESRSSATRLCAATRSGGSGAVGRSRAPSGWSRRRPRRFSAAVTSTGPLTATGGPTCGGSSSITCRSPTSQAGGRRTPSSGSTTAPARATQTR